MKKLLTLILFAPCLSLAQTPYDGTWVANVDTAQMPEKPEVYFLDNNTYRCSTTCVPEVEIKADGTDQKVTGHAYYDSVAARIVDDRTAEVTMKRNGKVVYSESDAIHSDGNTMTVNYRQQRQVSSEPVNGEMTYKRVDKRPANAHALSGSWRAEKINSMSSNGLTVTYQGTENGLKMSLPTGESYDARMDGKDYPIEGDPGHTVVSIKRVGDSIEETNKRDGKVVGIARLSVSSDGKTMDVVWDDKIQGTTLRYKMEKQM